MWMQKFMCQMGADLEIISGEYMFHPHKGTTFFVEGVKNFFMFTWVKNSYRGGDVFGCHCLGEGRGKGGRRKF